MYTYTCILCDSSYESNLVEKENVCPDCRVDYGISDDYVYGNADETTSPNTEQLENRPKPYDGPSDQEILNYYMYGNQYDEPVGKPPMQSKPRNLYVPEKIDFNTTKEISLGFWNGVIRADDRNKLWYYSTQKTTRFPVYHKFSDIASYDLYQDSDLITKGGTGRAIAGGLAFGVTGAIIGGSTAKRKTVKVVNEMYIRVSFKTISADYVKIPLCGSVRTDSPAYHNAREMANQVIALLDAMVSQTQINTDAEHGDLVAKNHTDTSTAPLSPADEILKFKSLLDCGAITEEEYETVKKRLLDF